MLRVTGKAHPNEHAGESDVPTPDNTVVSGPRGWGAPMKLLLVRHGYAGSKSAWSGDDRLRPLEGRGWSEARGLADVLRPFKPTRILSSPYVRCVQTVEPYSREVGLTIGEEKGLGPRAGKTAVRILRRLDDEADEAVVLCTHGEVIRDIQGRLEGRGRLFGLRPSTEKGSVWVLDRTGRKFVNAQYIQPRRSQ
jgi:phosphohistidine phosphatase SixA